MKIKLIAVGTRMPSWVEEAYTQYSARMPAVCQLQLHQVAAKKRGKNADIARVLREEAESMLALVPTGSKVIILERTGKVVTTEYIAQQMQNWIDQSQDVAILIGGPEGVDAKVLAQNSKWSLSNLTFVHPMVRVILAEQLYRAWSIIANLPYHRGA